jgi:hypothetical protein
MKILYLTLFLLIGCSHVKKQSEVPRNEVSMDAALDQARASYLKGCVDAFKQMKQGPSFPKCVEKAKKHRQELEQIVTSPIIEENI